MSLIQEAFSGPVDLFGRESQVFNLCGVLIKANDTPGSLVPLAVVTAIARVVGVK